MRYKGNIIIIMLAIFLFSIVSVCASEMDTPMAGEDTGQIELSANDEVIEENLQTGEEDAQPTQSDPDETVSVNDELDVLSEGEGTYTELSEEINGGGNKSLTKTYYRFTAGDTQTSTIKITTSGVIDGKGAIIDMNGSTIQAFIVTAYDVTIKNLTI